MSRGLSLLYNQNICSYFSFSVPQREYNVIEQLFLMGEGGNVRGVVGRHKQYVEVIVDIATDGTKTPLAIVWEDGTHYPIACVLDARKASSKRFDGSGMRYTVRVGTVATHLFCEGDRWFVEAKEAPLP